MDTKGSLEQLARETAEKWPLCKQQQLRADILAALRQAVEKFNRDIDHWHDLYKEEQAKVVARDELLRDMAALIDNNFPGIGNEVLIRYEAFMKESK